MSTEKQTHLLDDLQDLLEKQIELAQQGNISGVEVLSKQANSLVRVLLLQLSKPRLPES